MSTLWAAISLILGLVGGEATEAVKHPKPEPTDAPAAMTRPAAEPQDNADLPSDEYEDLSTMEAFR